MALGKKKQAPKDRILIEFSGERTEVKMDKGINANAAIKTLENIIHSLTKSFTEKVKAAGLVEPGEAQQNFITAQTLGDLL
ncbi:hypothetical protein [uncultured Mucilaginibacter sp.]|uniref:hypothetical protein n=1 Tax=uncultured Mucilaginibacter sp. TaxID=797541 RepID=UPI0025F88F68|nr:hypothetical protein [uncultured Mucilaginibacter sp.]